MRRLTHLIVLGAFLFSCGGQWYALQCVAWVSMVHDYAKVVSITEAVSMTFSGKYPCELCRVIAEKKSADNAKLVIVEKYQKKFLPPLAVAKVVLTGTPQVYFLSSESLSTRTEPPPVPPPRRILS